MTSSDPPPTDIDVLARDREQLAQGSMPDAMLDAMFDEVAKKTVEGQVGWRGRLLELPTPVRSGVLLLVMLLVGAGSLVAQGPRADMGAVLGTGRFVSALLVLSAVALLAATWSVRGLHKHNPLTPARILVVLALMGPAITLLVPGFWPGLPMPEGEAMRFHRACFAGGALAATGCAAASMLLQRFDRPPTSRVLLAAGAGGIVGFVVQQLHCAVAQPFHLFIAHAIAGLVVSGVVIAAIRFQRDVR